MTFSDGDRATEHSLSVFGLLSVLLRHRAVVLGFPAVGLALAIALVTLKGRTYVSSAAFLPQAKPDLRSGLSGLASQFGLPLPMAQQGESPAFYADLLQSRPIVEAVVRTEYAFTARGQRYRGDLTQLFRARGATRALRVEAAMEAVRRTVVVTKGRETGLVRFSVETRYAPLSQLIAKRMLELLSEYNLKRRQSQGAAESRFVSQRYAEAAAELRAAEDRLQAFLQRNRDYRNSPQLSFTVERLEREVSLRQTVYSTLSELHEQARIEEVRDTPVITVVEPPPLPAKSAPRGWIEKGLVGLVAGAILGLFAAFGAGFLERTRSAFPAEFRRYAELRDVTLQDLREPLRRLGRLFRPVPGSRR